MIVLLLPVVFFAGLAWAGRKRATISARTLRSFAYHECSQFQREVLLAIAHDLDGGRA